MMKDFYSMRLEVVVATNQSDFYFMISFLKQCFFFVFKNYTTHNPKKRFTDQRNLFSSDCLLPEAHKSFHTLSKFGISKICMLFKGRLFCLLRLHFFDQNNSQKQ